MAAEMANVRARVQVPVIGEFKIFTKKRLDRLVCKLELSQRKSETLASELKEMNLLAADANVRMYRNRQRNFVQYFTVNAENTFVFCHDCKLLMGEMGIQYNPGDWRIFIDSSKTSMKAVLLHVTNTEPSVPLAYSNEMRETYETMKLILESVKYNEHKWRFCAGLKVVSSMDCKPVGRNTPVIFVTGIHVTLGINIKTGAGIGEESHGLDE